MHLSGVDDHKRRLAPPYVDGARKTRENRNEVECGRLRRSSSPVTARFVFVGCDGRFERAHWPRRRSRRHTRERKRARARASRFVVLHFGTRRASVRLSSSVGRRRLCCRAAAAFWPPLKGGWRATMTTSGSRVPLITSEGALSLHRRRSSNSIRF